MGAELDAHLQRVADSWRQRLPPADVLQLDGGYLVVRRGRCRARRPVVVCEPLTPVVKRCSMLPLQQGKQQRRPGLPTTGLAAAAPVAWTTAHEQHYQRRLACMRLLAQARLALPRQPGATGEARFVAALAAAAITARTLRSLCTSPGPHP